MKIAALICRILLGLIFLASGVLKFLPLHAAMPPGDAGAWSLLMMNHHWMTIVGIFETVGGLLLLSGRFVPLGLTLVAPICVNVLLFSFLFAPATAVPGVIASILDLFLIYAYRSYFAPLFTAKAVAS
jgi:putative oxidoreductase